MAKINSRSGLIISVIAGVASFYTSIILLAFMLEALNTSMTVNLFFILLPSLLSGFITGWIAQHKSLKAALWVTGLLLPEAIIAVMTINAFSSNNLELFVALSFVVVAAVLIVIASSFGEKFANRK